MSYDLFLKPRSGSFDAKQFTEYFGTRRHYKVQMPQAWYGNEDTGVYFLFEMQDKPEPDEGQFFPVVLNVNYIRPSFFGLEAEPEVTAFVRAFDMTVFDPQMNGMGEGEYKPEKFLSGWNDGNEFGCSAYLRDANNRKNLVSYPTASLLKAWSWNRDREELQRGLGESKFVPKIMFLVVCGLPVTAATWPDGIPVAIPEVDYFIIPRKKLAPRRFLRRREDCTLLSWSDALPLLTRHQFRRPDGTAVLDYDNPPDDVKRFLESLPKNLRELRGIAPENALNQELVEKWDGNEAGGFVGAPRA